MRSRQYHHPLLARLQDHRQTPASGCDFSTFGAIKRDSQSVRFAFDYNSSEDSFGANAGALHQAMLSWI